MKHYDAIIIGLGSAGQALAKAFIEKGLSVAAIEKSRNMVGGTNINKGDIPSKTLIERSKLAKTAELDQKLWYSLSVDYKDNKVNQHRAKTLKELESLEGLDIYYGQGSFVSNHQVKVDETILLEADKIFVTTGSKPYPFKHDGLVEDPRVVTANELMNLKELPKRLAIVGGGYIGLEFACMYANFGSEVSVYISRREFLPFDDRDVAQEILHLLRRHNIEVHVYADLSYVVGDVILVAKGRWPLTSELNLSATSVFQTKSGALIVNECCQTNVKDIYALGDVTDGPKHTYLAIDDARIVINQMFGDGTYSRDTRLNIPKTLFLDVPYSRVGMNEQEASETELSYSVKKLKQNDVYMKVLIDDDSQLILGAMLLCENSNELINMIKLAMDNEIPYTQLRDQIYTHPSACSAFNELFK